MRLDKMGFYPNGTALSAKASLFWLKALLDSGFLDSLTAVFYSWKIGAAGTTTSWLELYACRSRRANFPRIKDRGKGIQNTVIQQRSQPFVLRTVQNGRLDKCLAFKIEYSSLF